MMATMTEPAHTSEMALISIPRRKALRLAARMTLADVATACRAGSASVWRWEMYDQTPRFAAQRDAYEALIRRWERSVIAA